MREKVVLGNLAISDYRTDERLQMTCDIKQTNRVAVSTYPSALATLDHSVGPCAEVVLTSTILSPSALPSNSSCYPKMTLANTHARKVILSCGSQSA